LEVIGMAIKAVVFDIGGVLELCGGRTIGRKSGWADGSPSPSTTKHPSRCSASGNNPPPT
jgi:hypothetical protein